MKTILVVICITLAILTGCIDKKTVDQSTLQIKLDSLITEEHLANKFDGTIVIGTTDTVLFQKAIGTANRVWEVPIRMDSRFNICSVNKSFIAALILIAVEENKVSLTDQLVDLLGQYEYDGMFSDKITIHHMLTHTSGLTHYEGVADDLKADNFLKFKRMHLTNDEYVNLISQVPPVSEPGQQFSYSSFAYHLLSIILQDIYQLSFNELLDQKICQPLELRETINIVSNQALTPNLVEGYQLNESKNKWYRNEFLDMSIGTNICSTSMDLYEWGKAMNDNSLLTDRSLRIMQTNHLAAITADLSYGYGWAVFDQKGEYGMGNLEIDKKYIIHGGNWSGYKSMLVNIEQGEYIIAFLANTGDQTNEMKLTKKIVQILINSENDK